jgi:hypothetical protein
VPNPESPLPPGPSGLRTQDSGLSRFARLLSILGHPLLLVPLTVAVTTRNWRPTAIIAATTVLPLVLVLLRRVRRGTWSDFDVSRRDQRAGLYHVGFAVLALTAVALYLLGTSAAMLRGVAAAAVMFGLGLAGNRFLKISLHLMLATYCAVVVTRIYPATLLPVIPFLFALAWSRHHLGHHTPAELLTGTIIGLGAGWFALA